MKLTVQEKILLFVCVFSTLLILIVPLWAGFPLNFGDMAFHVANHKSLWSGEQPFSSLMDYPNLFYLNPLSPLVSMPIICCIIIPILIYYLAKEFISREYCPYAALFWMGLIPLIKTLTAYGQMYAMVFILIFLILYLRKNKWSPLLLIPPIFGHNGSIQLVLALCFFVFLDTLLKKDNRYFMFGLHLQKNNGIIPLILPSHIMVTLAGMLGNNNIEKNKMTHALLLLIIAPSLLFNIRGMYILAVICSISIVKLLPFDPDFLIYPLCFIMIYGIQLGVQDEVFGNEYFIRSMDIIVESHAVNGSYCFYNELDNWAYSYPTVWKWINYKNISVIMCSTEQYNENIYKSEHRLFEKRFNEIVISN